MCKLRRVFNHPCYSTCVLSWFLVTLVLFYFLPPIVLDSVLYDAYLLRHYIKPCSSNPFGVTSLLIQVWQDIFSSPLFEFHGKGHFIEFYLNYKMPFLKDVVLDSKCSNLVTLVTQLQGGLNPFYCFRISFQKVSIPIKKISCHLDFICPSNSALKVQLHNLPRFQHSNPIL